jgi:kynurenine formamidase
VVRAAALVRSGKRFNLDYPVNAFEPFPTGTRYAAGHHMFANNPHHRDDYLDSFYLQSSSHIDSLRHIGHPARGFYGGRAKEDITASTDALGIHHYAQAGIVGRGVLLDVDRHLAAQGTPLELNDPTAFDGDLLDAVAAAQGVELAPGDILLLHTGWAARYLALTTGERIALVAADNTGVERSPAQQSDFFDPAQPPPERGPNHNGMIHRPLIALLGMALGELWALDDLAADCAEDRRYEFLLVASPLNLVGGAGSPCNAIAIK